MRSSILRFQSCLRSENHRARRSKLCFCCNGVQIQLLVFLEKSACAAKVKKRSPNVWRYHFVFTFAGPTKCRRVANVWIDARVLSRERTKTFTRKEFLSRR